MTDSLPPQEPPGFSRYLRRAQELINQPKRVLELLGQVPDKLRNSPSVTYLGARISLSIRLLRAWMKGEYTAVPHTTLVALLAALIYFVFILDLIPDFLFWVGILDDSAVLTYVLTRFNKDLQDFETWEEGLKESEEKEREEPPS